MNKLQTGITLIESLVALMVLSIGLLGTAHLMATGIKQSNGSFSRTQATYLAENLAERMRANPVAITNNNYDGFDSNSTSCSTKPSVWCEGTGATACTAPQLATYDQFQASCGTGGSTNGDNGVKALLPNGRLQIDCNDVPCTDTSTYTIQISWSEVEQSSATSDTTKVKNVQHVILP